MELMAKKMVLGNNLIMTDKFARFLLYSVPPDLWNNMITYQYSTFKSNKANREIKTCYAVLGVPDGSDQETVRRAFVDLVKRFHPDSGTSEADAARFQEIESAYRKLQDKFSSDRWRHNDCIGEYGLYYVEKFSSNTNVQEQDIEHTAPQHRQYLSYDGFGFGTPSQRHKQYQKQRAESAANRVYGYRVKQLQEQTACTDEQALIVKDKSEAKKIKTRYGLERLVEDLIQESMAKGEFDNLQGQGKPLTRQFDHHNPYVDLVTHKLNQVLIDNGFKPEWIILQKEIDIEIQRLKLYIIDVRKNLGPVPLTGNDAMAWNKALDSMHKDIEQLNQKITKYNLVVPLLRKQMLHFNLIKVASKILQEGEYRKPGEVQKNLEEKQTKKEHFSILNFVFSLFS